MTRSIKKSQAVLHTPGFQFLEQPSLTRARKMARLFVLVLVALVSVQPSAQSAVPSPWSRQAGCSIQAPGM